MLKSRAELSGQMVGLTLAGCWRRLPPPSDLNSVGLEEIVPLLQISGAAALGWWRLSHSNLAHSTSAETLRGTYRLNTLQAKITQNAICEVVDHLRSVGIEPILVKGWAAARLYPDQGLRPYGDIDLCVRPDEFESAGKALEDLGDRRYDVDLHCGFESLGGGDVDEVHARSRIADLGNTKVRLPCAEDHLRILCMHFLREGGWRPLWLCDIAAAVEALPEEFDWSYCLGNNRSRSDAIICSIAVAHQLLGADIDQTPAARKTRDLPRWLVPAILKEWGSPQPSMSGRHRAPIASYIRYPYKILRGLRDRWPNPIEATVGMRGPFNDFPRLPFQIGSCLARAATFATRFKQTRREH
ncbi:MAG: hypothetical protein QOJ64_2869 [Acidobacteriota bacterium]|nr:hypothetical protein [Acidobacteriota bacterium]